MIPLLKKRLNGTRERDQEIMIFVRVPKTGSQLMNQILRQQSQIHNYTTIVRVLSMQEMAIHEGEYIFEPNQLLRYATLFTLHIHIIDKYLWIS